jgi:hypothetical protein
MRIPGSTDYSVYFGDVAGNVYDLNGTGTSGDAGSSTVLSVRKTRVIDANDKVQLMNHIVKGSVQYRRVGACSFSIDFDWADEYNNSTCTVNLKGPPANDGSSYFGGAMYFGGAWYFGGTSFASKISHQQFTPVGKAPSVRLTFSTETNVQYQVDNVELL